MFLQFIFAEQFEEYDVSSTLKDWQNPVLIPSVPGLKAMPWSLGLTSQSASPQVVQPLEGPAVKGIVDSPSRWGTPNVKPDTREEKRPST